MVRFVVTLTACSILLLGANVAQAAKPIKFSGSGGGDTWLGDCSEGFEVWESVAYEVKGKDYFNKQGEWTRSRIHWTVEGMVYNASAPENYLFYKNSVYNEFFNAEMQTPILERIAEETGGRHYTPETVNRLAEDMTYTEGGTTVLERKDLWDMPAVFFLLVGLVGVAWGYRRWRGLA